MHRSLDVKDPIAEDLSDEYIGAKSFSLIEVKHIAYCSLVLSLLAFFTQSPQALLFYKHRVHVLALLISSKKNILCRH